MLFIDCPVSVSNDKAHVIRAARLHSLYIKDNKFFTSIGQNFLLSSFLWGLPFPFCIFIIPYFREKVKGFFEIRRYAQKFSTTGERLCANCTNAVTIYTVRRCNNFYRDTVKKVTKATVEIITTSQHRLTPSRAIGADRLRPFSKSKNFNLCRPHRHYLPFQYVIYLVIVGLSCFLGIGRVIPHPFPFVHCVLRYLLRFVPPFSAPFLPFLRHPFSAVLQTVLRFLRGQIRQNLRAFPCFLR